MDKNMKYALFLLLGILIGYFIFHTNDSKFIYGKTGLPKSCRAIIRDNYNGWVSKEFPAEEALDSINRNCGEFGYAWD